MKRNLAVLLATGVACLLVACGGGDDTPVQVVAADAVIEANPQTVPAVSGNTFTFPSGVAAFQTNAATTVAFTNTATTPAFAINSGGKAAVGTTTFGSCIFTITQSTFEAPSRLVVGAVIEVTPCNIVAGVQGLPADGQVALRGVALQLGASFSAGTEFSMSVGPGGQLTINGRGMGTVTLRPVTGA